MFSLYVFDSDILYNDSLFDSYYSQMSESRKSKIDGFKFRKDKNLSLACGILLDNKLKESGLTEKEMSYVIGPFGKPYFKNLSNLFFSLSHSGHYAIAVFSDEEVGCDIEEITTVEDSVKLAVLSQNEDKDRFFDYWTLKESYLKAKGTGICENLKDLSFTLGDKILLNKSSEFDFTLDNSIPGYKIAIAYKSSNNAYLNIS